MEQEQKQVIKFDSKKVKLKDGTIMFVYNNKLHNWDGAALIPQGNKKKAKYYIHGIEYSLKDFKKAQSDRNGVPYHKQANLRG